MPDSPPFTRASPMNRTSLLSIVLLALICPTSKAGELRAGAAAVTLTADDSMVIGGGIGPGKAHGQEGELRAAAVVVEDRMGERIALMACDVLMIDRDVLDRA